MALDFVRFSAVKKKNSIDIMPKFIVKYPSSDLMIRGGDFYAIWVEERGLWSTSEQDVISLIDRDLDIYAEEYLKKHPEATDVIVSHMWDADTGMIDKWHKYCQKQMRDSYSMLDENIVFANTDTKKDTYASKRLSYSLGEGDISAWDKLVSTLYSPEERKKIEWAIGSIVTGDSKEIQKFMVFYGSAGTGKSTILNIIQKLFDGYCATFEAKTLGSSNAQFALEPFKCNPLVAIQHDGNLSKIEDNTRLNSLVSHEYMTINEKFKSTYTNRFKCFLFMGTNQPVKITDAKSGILRRLIDVSPTGNKLSSAEYRKCMKKIDFELGAIAEHCKQVYLENADAYDDYVPLRMMSATNDFYDFVYNSYSVFDEKDGTTLRSAWAMYKQFCEDASVPYPQSRRIFREELKNYFSEFEKDVYSGFKRDKFGFRKSQPKVREELKTNWIKFKTQKSIFDETCVNEPAQYAKDDGTPTTKWISCSTILGDIDTSKVHYVKVPENHIVIDFDIPDESGNKCLEKNLEAAGEWPETYAELSKSGQGIHLHYIYNGDPTKLERVYAPNIEIKVYSGNSSLRRKLTMCNDIPVSPIGSGLPLKGGKVVSKSVIKSERKLRELIDRNLRKEIHLGTKPSVDFIFKILEDAYDSGLSYDVSDMYNDLFTFAMHSTNHSEYCLSLVDKMKLKSEDPSEPVNSDIPEIVFFDVESFPNLFLVNWKVKGEGKPVIRMINPSSSDIEGLLKYSLIGFYNRSYDNHMLYACLMGYSIKELYDLSSRLVSPNKEIQRKAKFGEAFNLSYTDVYDFAGEKKSLKKWEISLGIHHKELGLPWDEPVPEDRWIEVAEYCDNDVIATEAVFNHLQGDFTARKILADLAGMTVNDTTNSLTTKIVFGSEKNPRLVYTDLATGERDDGIKRYFPDDDIIHAFPGYSYEYSITDGKFHNTYRGVDVGRGGYVYGNPGMYGNVALLDIASMHPTSAETMNCFGEYTPRFSEIKQARIYIKHGDFDAARKMMDGRLAPYLDDPSVAKSLSYALKIAINSVYGLTAASFPNAFKDVRNTNNIVALRGALFMKTLQDEVEAMGYTIVHIKVDSIKIADADQKIIDFCMEFAKKYGYTFEHEATYDRICLVNDAVYIAKYNGDGHAFELTTGEKIETPWTATGDQFRVPYVFKTLFSRSPIVFKDMCETFSVTKGSIYLDFNEKLPDVSAEEKELKKAESMYKDGKLSDTTFEEKCAYLNDIIETGHDYRFVGRVGQFCPMTQGSGGAVMYRYDNGKYYAPGGSKGYRWMESEIVKDNVEDCIDIGYYQALVNDATDAINKFGDFDWFVSDEPYVADPATLFRDVEPEMDEEVPWD